MNKFTSTNLKNGLSGKLILHSYLILCDLDMTSCKYSMIAAAWKLPVVLVNIY